MGSVNIVVPDLHEVHKKLDTLIRADIQILALLKVSAEKEKLIMATLDQILENVSAQTTRIDSLNTLMDGIRQQLADVLSGVVIPPQVQAKLDAIFDVATVNAGKIDEAIVENTPAEPLTPAEV